MDRRRKKRRKREGRDEGRKGVGRSREFQSRGKIQRNLSRYIRVGGVNGKIMPPWLVFSLTISVSPRNEFYLISDFNCFTLIIRRDC